jgi:hypothetical protein
MICPLWVYQQLRGSSTKAKKAPSLNLWPVLGLWRVWSDTGDGDWTLSNAFRRSDLVGDESFGGVSVLVVLLGERMGGELLVVVEMLAGRGIEWVPFDVLEGEFEDEADDDAIGTIVAVGGRITGAEHCVDGCVTVVGKYDLVRSTRGL